MRVRAASIVLAERILLFRIFFSPSRDRNIMYETHDRRFLELISSRFLSFVRRANKLERIKVTPNVVLSTR